MRHSGVFLKTSKILFRVGWPAVGKLHALWFWAEIVTDNILAIGSSLWIDAGHASWQLFLKRDEVYGETCLTALAFNVGEGRGAVSLEISADSLALCKQEVIIKVVVEVECVLS